MAGATHYSLCLYIAGATPRSLSAIAALQKLCAHQLLGRCTLTVVDIHLHPQRAVADRVMVAPTLVREQPQPERRLTGDCSDIRRVCTVLGLS